jgi:hypothetical protein
MKKIFLLLLLFTIVIADRNYSQSLRRPEHKNIKTGCRKVLNDTCQTESYTICRSSNQANKRTKAEFPMDSPTFICPIGDDIYRKILGRALKGIQIAY